MPLSALEKSLIKYLKTKLRPTGEDYLDIVHDIVVIFLEQGWEAPK